MGLSRNRVSSQLLTSLVQDDGDDRKADAAYVSLAELPFSLQLTRRYLFKSIDGEEEEREGGKRTGRVALDEHVC